MDTALLQFIGVSFVVGMVGGAVGAEAAGPCDECSSSSSSMSAPVSTAAGQGTPAIHRRLPLDPTVARYRAGITEGLRAFISTTAGRGA